MDKLTVEQWDALTPEDQETRLDEMPEELAEPGSGGKPEVKDEEKDEQGVSYKNRAAEANRKREALEKKNTEAQEQITKLQNQVDSSTSPPEKHDALPELRTKLTELGYEKELVDVVSTAVNKLTEGKTPQNSAEVEQLRALVTPILQNVTLNEAEKADKFGVVKRHKDEIKEELSKLPPKVKGTPEAVEWAVNKIKSKYFGEGSKEKPAGSPTLPPSTGGSGTTTPSADEKEAVKYSNETGVDIQAARRIVGTRKKALEKKNE